MVLRSRPASRRRKLSVPRTSRSGRPAAKPSARMRRPGAPRATRPPLRPQGRGGGGKSGGGEWEGGPPPGTRAGWCATRGGRRGARRNSGGSLAPDGFVYYSRMCFSCPAFGPTACMMTSSPWSARRAFLLAAGAGAATPVLAQVDVGAASSLRKLVSAPALEQAAARQYQQMLSEAQARRVLVSRSHPSLQRLHAIARRLM